jgi:hypothetical protein
MITAIIYIDQVICTILLSVIVITILSGLTITLIWYIFDFYCYLFGFNAHKVILDYWQNRPVKIKTFSDIDKKYQINLNK